VITDLLARAHPFSVELKTQFRSVTKRVGFIIIGEHGVGEWAPFDDYKPEAAAKWLAAALEAADSPRKPLHHSQIPVNGIVPALSPRAASDWAASLVENFQVNTLKIKVGDAEQLDRVKAIADRLPGITLRVDANGSYGEAEAIALIDEYKKLGVAVIEQPCQTLQQCQAVRGRGVLVAVDESIRLANKVDDKLISDIKAAADIAVLKPIPLGGSVPTLELAQKLDLPVIISGSLDTSIGLSFVTYVAGLMPNLPLASGLGTSVLLNQDLVAESLLPKAGSMQVVPPVLSEQLLQAAKERVSSVELENLTQRLTAAAEALTETIEVNK
jgi:o-succinylbenzoate synthase